MTILTEYRIVLPLELQELEKGRLWHLVEQMKLELTLLETDADKGQQFGEKVVHKETVSTNHMPSIFSTERLTKEQNGEHLVKEYGSPEMESRNTVLGSKALSGFLDAYFAQGVRVTTIDSFDSFPYFSSTSRSRPLGSRYEMKIEGMAFSGLISAEDNPMKLSPSALKERQLVVVDIAADVPPEDYRETADPKIFTSTKTGRGPLVPGEWMEKLDIRPATLCIVVEVNFNFLGPVGRIAERQLHAGMLRAIALHHRELVCSMDKWYDADMSDLKTSLEEIRAKTDDFAKKNETPLNLTGPAPDQELQGGCCAFNVTACADFLHDFKNFFAGFFKDFRDTECVQAGNSIIVLTLVVIASVGTAIFSSLYF